MRKTRKLIIVTTSTLLSFLTILTHSIRAQALPIPGGQNNNNPGLGFPVMKTWSCSKEKAAIAVEALEVGAWKDIIEGEGWQCAQEIPDIATGDLKFSCEPDENLGILTVTWLKGEAAKSQLEAWMKELADRQGLICRMSQVKPWGAEQDVP